MDTNEEEGSGQGLERDVNTEAVLAQEKTGDVKPTYKSFKYGFPSECDVYISIGGQLSQSMSTCKARQETTSMQPQLTCCQSGRSIARCE